MVLKYILFALAWYLSGVAADNFVDKLVASEQATTNALDQIYRTWEVQNYPLFLKTAWMPKHSWDHMIAKFEERILDVHSSKKVKNFTISFTGSSVTAGHDSMFSDSYPVVVGNIMKPAFEPMGINLVSNNDAMGNNPCMPYDACVATYSGPDADIVHWEQQFNCYIDGDPRMVEQFVRQSRFMPKNPLVVIAGSMTPNWHDGDCKNVKPHVLSTEEKEYTQLVAEGGDGLMKIFTEMNKGDRSKFPRLHDMLKTYPSAGIQSFDHHHYEVYKCLGPYIPKWGDGVASWHPSRSGHALRANHYAYVWLTAYKLALQKVQAAYKKGDKIVDMLKSVSGYLSTLRPVLPLPSPVSKTQSISDDVQCYTAFEPHQDRERTLTQRVVEGMQSSTATKPWAITQLEQLLDPGIIKKSHERGYLDEKYIIYGSSANGPLSFKVTVKKLGTFYVCEAPGVWGKLPNGFAHLWESAARMFMIPVKSLPSSTFTFSKKDHESFEVTYVRKEQDEICVHFDKVVDPGNYVLSIVATKEVNIMVSTLLIP